MTTTEHDAPAPATSHAEAETERFDVRADCRACLGTGKVLRTADWLQMSLRVFPTDDAAAMDAFVAEFYRRLVERDAWKDEGDHLGPLFPADLTTGDALNSQGNRQRDMLLNAIVGLISSYDPDRTGSDDMKHLVRLLQKAGRDHKGFLRPDGTVRPPSKAEYAEVFEILVGLIHDTFGEKWYPEFDTAWTWAYDFAVDVMRGAAAEANPPGQSAATFGRIPRAAR